MGAESGEDTAGLQMGAVGEVSGRGTVDEEEEAEVTGGDVIDSGAGELTLECGEWTRVSGDWLLILFLLRCRDTEDLGESGLGEDCKPGDDTPGLLALFVDR